jgi:hypothetical protein
MFFPGLFTGNLMNSIGKGKFTHLGQLGLSKHRQFRQVFYRSMLLLDLALTCCRRFSSLHLGLVYLHLLSAPGSCVRPVYLHLQVNTIFLGNILLGVSLTIGILGHSKYHFVGVLAFLGVGALACVCACLCARVAAATYAAACCH